MGVLRHPVYFEAHKVLAYEHELNQLSKKPLKYVSDSSNSVAIEKHEASSTISRICVGPSCLDFLDDILLFSLFRDTIVFNDKGYNYGAGEQVEVKVSVSHQQLFIQSSFRTILSHPCQVNDYITGCMQIARRRR